MKCVTCKEGEPRATEVRHTVMVGGRTFAAKLRADKCPACGEVFFDADTLVRFELGVAADLAEHGPVTGESFRYMRSAMGLPAADLAPLLGVTPETVSRWERGRRDVDRAAWATVGSLVLEHGRGSIELLERLRALTKPRKGPSVVKVELAARR